MFSKLFNRRLKISIEGSEFTFDTVDELDFALAGRTHVTYERVQHALAMTDEELTAEATGIRAVEQHFVDVLSRAMEGKTSIGPHFRGMDIKLFSQDHHWREIITELNRYDESFDEFKHIALAKYMQYLASRQEVVQAIYADRVKRRQEQVADQPEGDNAMLRETLLFDISENLPPVDTSLARMPKGEAIRISLEPGADINLRLSKHPFRLVPGETPVLIDVAGRQTYPLISGHNFVGRESNANINVDAHYRDVSRKHLLIQVESSRTAYLTDLSSHGSFINPSYLDRTSDNTAH